MSHKNSELSTPAPNFNVVWRCECIWVDSSCHPGSLYLTHNIEFEEGDVRIGTYCTLSNVLKILTGFDQALCRQRFFKESPKFPPLCSCDFQIQFFIQLYGLSLVIAIFCLLVMFLSKQLYRIYIRSKLGLRYCTMCDKLRKNNQSFILSMMLIFQKRFQFIAVLCQ